MNTVPAWNSMTIFAVVLVVVGFSMFMGRRSPRHGTRGGGWAGLIVLLIVLSAFFGTTIFRARSVQEVRYAGRTSWTEDMREEIQERVRQAKEQAEGAVGEAKRAMSNAMKRKEDKGRPRTRVEAPDPPPAPPGDSAVEPLKQVVFEISLPRGERAQKLEDLVKRLKVKAADHVTDWARERVQYRVWIGRVVTPEFLEAQGAFPQPVEPESEPVPGVEGADKDYLYNGVLKVVLSPTLQQHIMNDTWRLVDQRLKEEKLMQQGIISIMLLGATIGAGAIGSLCFLHRAWKTRDAELGVGIVA